MVTEGNAPVPAQKRPILVCADDYGMHPVVDQAVLALAAKGRLSGASCLVHGVSFQESGRALQASGVQCGLHLNFTERLHAEEPIMPLPALIRACWLRRLDRKPVMQSISRQLDRYEYIMGQRPHYIDGHQHVHQFPVIREALLEVLNGRYSGHDTRPWIRSTVAARQAGIPPVARMKSQLIALLGAHTMRRLAMDAGYGVNNGFLGVYGFQGGAATYARLLQNWLATVPAGAVIMCHPAVDAVPGDPLGGQRYAEFSTWNSERVGEWLSESGLTVATPEQSPA